MHKLDSEFTMCEICYSSNQGLENFFLFSNCLHFFCKQCLRDYATDLIMRGQVGKLFCPCMEGCKTFMTEGNLTDIGIDQNVIDKFNQFSFDVGIASMEDMGYCPKPDCASTA